MQEQKKILLLTIGKIIKKYRNKKSISQIANEIDISKSIWSELESGNRDVQISTLWKIAEGMNIKPSVIIKEVEKNLSGSFSFIENFDAKMKK